VLPHLERAERAVVDEVLPEKLAQEPLVRPSLRVA
jgi:hypothetical protein